MLLQFNQTETTRMITTITPATENSDPIAPVPVIAGSLNGKLAIHFSIEAPGYSVTHIPSGFAVATRIVAYKDAENLMLVLENRANWNFRSAKSKIWKDQMSELWNYVKDVPQH